MVEEGRSQTCHGSHIIIVLCNGDQHDDIFNVEVNLQLYVSIEFVCDCKIMLMNMQKLHKTQGRCILIPLMFEKKCPPLVKKPDCFYF